MESAGRKARLRGLEKVGGRKGKTFVCKHNGCGKQFTRSEHLNRHALNHTTGSSTCERCQAHFKRPDLLARHMERHKQRDEEAGGNGILNTRKRLWKDLDGTIVQKRPSVPESDKTQPPQEVIPTSVLTDGPLSPPTSHESSDIQPSHTDIDLLYGSEGGSDPLDFTSFLPTATSGALDNFTFQDLVAGFYEDVFQPDTASSFNMPYTTATDYNWLFDLNNSFDTQFGPLETQGTDFNMVDNSSRQQSRSLQATGQGSGNTIRVEQPEIPGTNQERSRTRTTELIHRQIASRFSSPQPSTSRRVPDSATQKAKTPSECIELPERESPLSTLREPHSLPCIDECTRSEILDLIEALQPILPELDPLTRDNKHLSLASLQGYLDLFFTRFNTAYPLIHQPTFVVSEVETQLLLAMLLLGATYSSKVAHQLAVCIHDVMRPAIFAHPGFSAKPELWMLETILLVECFGKSRAGQTQHDMSHLFHGLLINLIRRSDCQTVQPLGPHQVDETDNDLETQWHQWAEAEQKKRLALLCFLWDTQHAVLFCQSLCMSSFELRTSLPCSQSLWEAQTASEWKDHGDSSVEEPQFLTTLKSYLTASSPRPTNLNSLSRVLILHGLMSVFWDMQRRDQTSLGVISGDQTGNYTSGWRQRISKAYDLWKSDFDSHCMAGTVSHRENNFNDDDQSIRTRNAQFAVFSTSYNAIYHAAHILLNSDFLDLQVYAGARHILGRPVQRNDYIRSERVVKAWASGETGLNNTQSATKAAWHASLLLQDATQNLTDFDAMGLFHVPWCLYLASLTCWAFHNAGKSRAYARDDEDEMIWDAKLEMNAMVESMASSGDPRELAELQGAHRTGGLVWVMANVLERVRWGIVHAGVSVLRGLVPWRLVNRFEAP